jgi:hypothetical protein
MLPQDIRYLRNIERFIKQSILPEDAKKNLRDYSDRPSAKFKGRPKHKPWQKKPSGSTWQRSKRSRQESAYI